MCSFIILLHNKIFSIKLKHCEALFVMSLNKILKLCNGTNSLSPGIF